VLSLDATSVLCLPPPPCRCTCQQGHTELNWPQRFIPFTYASPALPLPTPGTRSLHCAQTLRQPTAPRQAQLRQAESQSHEARLGAAARITELEGHLAEAQAQVAKASAQLAGAHQRAAADVSGLGWEQATAPKCCASWRLAAERLALCLRAGSAGCRETCFSPGGQ